MKRLAWHFDFHSCASVRIGHHPDVDGMADALAAAHVEEIITFAKCHTGFTYYPSMVGTVHPRMKGDPFGDVLRACRARNIKVLAYVSFGIDGEAARRHPGWARYHAPGECGMNKDHFIGVCPFTPYMSELFLPQVREIIEIYRPDGFFFDTMSAFGVCYCDVCRQAFRDARDLDIPERPGDTHWGEYGRFRHDRAFGMLEQIGAFITDLLPEAIIGFNQIGSPPYPEKMPATIRRLTLDFATYGPQSRQASLCANYGSTAPLPSDIMPTRFNQGWGDWSAASRSSLEQVAAPVLAFGERLFMGDRLHPANRIAKGTGDALEYLSELWESMHAEMPPEGTARQPDAILLHSPSMVYGRDMESFAVNNRLNLRPLDGAHRMLIDAGFNFAIVAEDYLDDWLQENRFLVLPELPGLSVETNRRIEEFLETGGRILVVGTVPRVEGKPVAWLGVEEETTPWQDHLYLPSNRDSDDPVLVRGTCFRVAVSGAETLLNAIPPYDLRFGDRMGWGINPPADAPSDSVVLSRNHVGKGAACYLACALFTDYATGINFRQKQWLETSLAEMAPPRQQRLTSPYGSVELIPYACDKIWWSVLLNHGGEELGSTPPWPRTVGPQPPYPVTLELTHPETRRPAAVLCNGHACDWSQAGDSVQVKLIMDSLWKVVRVEWC